MISIDSKVKYLGVWKPFVMFFFFFSLSASRRWQQFTSPQVWDEDGTQVLYEYIVNNGWLSLFEPVNGYLIFISKLISFLSIEISVTSYPIVSTVITCLFIAFIGMAVVYSPTKLMGKWFCAVAIFIVPSDPEVFNLPLYAFWWGSLLLFLVAVWDENSTTVLERILFLLIGGLSSPLIIMVLPVFYYRIYIYRSFRNEFKVAIVATIIAIIQYSFIHSAGVSGQPNVVSILFNTIPVFLGYFIVGNLSVSNSIILWIAGILIIAGIAKWVFLERSPLSYILVYLLAGSIALSVARIDPSILHPVLAGPRYFFFPYILIFWMLIQLGHKVSAIWHYTFLGVMLLNVVPVWSRSHDDLKWKNHIVSCSLFPSKYTVPVHSDGNKYSAWSVELLGPKCAELLNNNFFGQNDVKNVATFPYSLKTWNGNLSEWHRAKIISNTMNGSDFQNSVLTGYTVIGSYKVSDSDTGELIVSLNKGDKLLYRSGPGKGGQKLVIKEGDGIFIEELPSALEWVELDFSNSALPDHFLVEISDNGKGWGEWSAIAVMKQ